MVIVVVDVEDEAEEVKTEAADVPGLMQWVGPRYAAAA